MKEWIYKDGSGEYVLTTDSEVANLAADAVEVPCGANKLTKCGLCLYFWNTVNNTTYVDGTGWQPCDNDSLCTFEYYIMDSDVHVIWQRAPNQETIDAMNSGESEYLMQGANGVNLMESIEQLKMGESGSSKKHSHYKRDVSHLNTIDPYRIADLYDLHPCAEHIMKKSLCAGGRGHKDLLRDIQDIIDTAERWKEMLEEDSNEV